MIEVFVQLTGKVVTLKSREWSAGGYSKRRPANGIGSQSLLKSGHRSAQWTGFSNRGSSLMRISTCARGLVVLALASSRECEDQDFGL